MPCRRPCLGAGGPKAGVGGDGMPLLKKGSPGRRTWRPLKTHSLSAQGSCRTPSRGQWLDFGPWDTSHTFPSLPFLQGDRNWVKSWKHLTVGQLFPNQVMGFPRLPPAASSAWDGGPQCRGLSSSAQNTFGEVPRSLRPPAPAFKRLPQLAQVFRHSRGLDSGLFDLSLLSPALIYTTWLCRRNQVGPQRGESRSCGLRWVAGLGPPSP